MFHDNLNTTSVLFVIADFNLLSCEFDCFTFKLLHYCIVSFHTDKNKLYFAFNTIACTKLLRFLVKIQKQFLLLFQ